MQKKYSIIGVMSGTSMDGVDVAHCTFINKDGKWTYQINKADCFSYNEKWISRLVHLHQQNAETFAKCHVYYGHLLGQYIREFILEHQLHEVDYISSHGQTIFHNPKKSYTVQIGHGAAIAKETGYPVICDLRTSDVAYGGQGAPIVPLGERDLFPQYNVFLNLGGITNIQIHQPKTIIGYDVCMANIVMDLIANKLNQPFDKDGHLAEQGTIHPPLLESLNSQTYFAESPPKSLHAEEVIQATIPLIEQANCSVYDQLATLVEHIAMQIAKACNNHHLMPNEPILVTGGGALNTFLINRIQSHCAQNIVLPETEIIEYKEALIMAYLGLKRIIGEPNVLQSVTGASKNTINGAVFLP